MYNIEVVCIVYFFVFYLRQEQYLFIYSFIY